MCVFISSVTIYCAHVVEYYNVTVLNTMNTSIQAVHLKVEMSEMATRSPLSKDVAWKDDNKQTDDSTGEIQI